MVSAVAWTAAERAQILGRRAPIAAWGSPAAVPPPSAAWPAADPAAPPAYVAEHGPRLISKYLELGWQNPKIVGALDGLETALRAQLANDQVGDIIISDLTTWAGVSAGLFDPPDPANPNAPLTVAAQTPARRAVIEQLVRNVLWSELLQHGFQAGAAPTTPPTATTVPVGPVQIPLAILPKVQFYNPIINRAHIQDPLVGLEHGEFTHMLQWYLLSIAPPDVLPGEGPFQPARVYSSLGRHALAQAALPSAPGDWDLWQHCSDRVAYVFPLIRPRATNIDDCRSPDHLHVPLSGIGVNREVGILAGLPAAARAEFTQWAGKWKLNRVRWPLLCGLLRRRVLILEGIYEAGERLRNAVAATVVAALHALTTGPFHDKIDRAASDLFNWVKGERESLTGGIHTVHRDRNKLVLLPGVTMTNTDWNDVDMHLANAVPPWIKAGDVVGQNSARAVAYLFHFYSNRDLQVSDWSAMPAGARDSLVSTSNQYYL